MKLLEEQVLSVLRSGDKVYSVEVAERLGFTKMAANRIAGVLRRLGEQGLLESELVRSGRKGHGRRYYWLKEQGRS